MAVMSLAWVLLYLVAVSSAGHLQSASAAADNEERSSFRSGLTVKLNQALNLFGHRSVTEQRRSHVSAVVSAVAYEYKIKASGRCEDEPGFGTIVDESGCLQAVRYLTADGAKAFKSDQPSGGYLETHSGRTRGCSVSAGSLSSDVQLYPKASGPCGTGNLHCVCRKASHPQPVQLAVTGEEMPALAGATTQDECKQACKAAGYCCNEDMKKGSNQFLSCLQACSLALEGKELDCDNRSCDVAENGWSQCGSCSCEENGGDCSGEKCSFSGVTGSGACEFGISLVASQNPTTTAAPKPHQTQQQQKHQQQKQQKQQPKQQASHQSDPIVQPEQEPHDEFQQQQKEQQKQAATTIEATTAKAIACSKEECNYHGDASGFLPDCECSCEDGWEGPYCGAEEPFRDPHCEIPRNNWRFKHLGEAIEMDVEGIKYGQQRVSKWECFSACGNHTYCKQAVYLKMTKSCFLMRAASNEDQDELGGTNVDWSSVHCNKDPCGSSDCSGNGKARGERPLCSCKCDTGYAGEKCDEVMPATTTKKTTTTTVTTTEELATTIIDSTTTPISTTAEPTTTPLDLTTIPLVFTDKPNRPTTTEAATTTDATTTANWRPTNPPVTLPEEVMDSSSTSISGTPSSKKETKKLANNESEPSPIVDAPKFVKEELELAISVSTTLDGEVEKGSTDMLLPATDLVKDTKPLVLNPLGDTEEIVEIEKVENGTIPVLNLVGEVAAPPMTVTFKTALEHAHHAGEMAVQSKGTGKWPPVKVFCGKDLKECPHGGKSVARDPYNDCNFNMKKCPSKPIDEPNPIDEMLALTPTPKPPQPIFLVDDRCVKLYRPCKMFFADYGAAKEVYAPFPLRQFEPAQGQQCCEGLRCMDANHRYARDVAAMSFYNDQGMKTNEIVGSIAYCVPSGLVEKPKKVVRLPCMEDTAHCFVHFRVL